MIYAKNKNNSFFIPNIPKDKKELIKTEDGQYIHKSGKRILVGENSFNKKIKSLDSDKHYTVYYHRNENHIEIKQEKKIEDKDQALINKGYVRYISHYNSTFIENTYTQNSFLKLLEENKLEFTDSKIFEKNYNLNIRLKNILRSMKYEAIKDNLEIEFQIDIKTTSANQYVKNLFNDIEVFTAPKGVDLITFFLTLFNDKDLTILDFFAGSGTTGDAVMQLNAKDGGNRKFILVQLDAPIDPKNSEVAYKFCTDNDLDPVISSITIERLNRAGDKILEKNFSEKPELKDSLDIGYKVFSIHDDPESKFLNSDISEYKQKKLFAEYSKIKNDPEFYTKENLIYNAYIYNNIPLSVTYQTLKDGILYQAENHYFCFGKISRDELEKHLNKHSEGVFTVFCGDGYVTDSFIHTCEAHLMQIAHNITYKVYG